MRSSLILTSLTPASCKYACGPRVQQACGRKLEEHTEEELAACQASGTGYPDPTVLKGIPSHLEVDVQVGLRAGFVETLHWLRGKDLPPEEPDVYFYHPDHLGSASWITDGSGYAVQHLQYLPFGERFVNQRTSGYRERFTFTGKERDAETGYGYF